MSETPNEEGCRCFGCAYERLAGELGDERASALMARDLGVDRAADLPIIAAGVRKKLHGEPA